MLCPILGLGRHANHIIGVAKIRVHYQERVRRHIHADTTILDHSGVVLSILRAPPALAQVRADWTIGSCTIWGFGKRANHIIGVAKIKKICTQARL